MRKLVLSIVAALTAVCSYAWSGQEHKLMAYMAEQHLTPNTQKFLERYLDQSIKNYATWMDYYRDAPGYEHTTNWHMIAIDENNKPVMAPDKGRIVGMIEPLEHAMDVLANYKDYNDSTVFISIVEIIHLIPELHCPSHYYYYTRKAETKASMKDCKFVLDNGTSTNHHHLWDASITILYPGLKEHKVQKIFDTWTPEQQKEVSDGTPRQWIEENAITTWEIYSWPTPGKHKASEYLAEHRELPEYRFRAAAYRLARVLNDLFDKEGAE